MAAAGVSAAMYSFSSEPKAVAGTRKKYRDPAESATAVFRDLKETNITWDKRVHRGNTYSMYTQNAIKDALREAVSPAQPPLRRKRRPPEKSVFDMGLPEQERVPVDLTKHLVASAESEVIKVDVAEAQTDEFVPLPPPEPYVPPKTGIDVSTQVEDGELFVFEHEVEPVLSVMVQKVLEQSVMEVEEEVEMEAMAEFKREWYRRKEEMLRDWEAQVAEAWVVWRRKEEILAEARARKRREAQVLLKVQALAASKRHLAGVVPNAVRSLQGVGCPDAKALAIDQLFMPELFAQVQRGMQTSRIAEQMVGEVANARAKARMARQRAAADAQRSCAQAAEEKRVEEKQIRRGSIRIHVDDGYGNKVVVGPVKISREDDVEQVQERIFAWLQENQPDLHALWKHGVELRINNLPVLETAEIFAAKSGTLSMLPKAGPASEDGGDDSEGGEGEEEEEREEDEAEDGSEP